jgi:hypothetical protein
MYGRVLCTGMTVVDAIAALPIYGAGALRSPAQLHQDCRRRKLATIPAIGYISSLIFTATSITKHRHRSGERNQPAR